MIQINGENVCELEREQVEHESWVAKQLGT